MAVTKETTKTVVTAAQGNLTAATGTITIQEANAANNDVVTVNGVAFTFKTTGATGNQVNIGTDAAASATALATALSASTNANVKKASYSAAGGVITVTAKEVGEIGNAFTLTAVGGAIALSGANLSGGSDEGATPYITAVPEEKRDSDLEQNLLAIIALVEQAIRITDDPSVDVNRARKQRKLIKNVLDGLTSFVPTVADPLQDDRERVSKLVKTKALTRFANLMNSGLL